MKLFILLFSILLLTSCHNKTTYDKPQTNSFQRDTTVKFLWRANAYDEELKDTFNSIFINEDYCKMISDPERAAIGYVATFVGSECDWDGKATNDMSNLKCKTLSSLHLGYQCSDQHLGFLRKWFRNDTAVLKDLADCPIIPFTAAVQNTFDEMTLTVKSDTVKVAFAVDGVNGKLGETWHYTEEDIFKATDNSINLLWVNHSAIKKEKIKIE